jgi:hypothetical protein
VLFDNAFCPETVTDFVQNNDLSNEKAVIEYSLSGSIHANYGKTNNEFFQSIVTEEIDTVISNNRKCNAELLASKLGCAGVQLSCGYYNANSPSEFTDINLIYSIGGTGVQLVNQIKKYGIFNY